jgi:hypothetical protein
MSEATATEFLRWFCAGVLALLGVFWAAAPRRFASVCAVVRPGSLPEAMRGRVRDAAARRKALEAVSPWYGYAIAFVAFGCAGACAFARVAPSLCYAAAMLATALAMDLAFAVSRRRGGKSVALLSARKATSVIPWYWFAAAGGGAFATLLGPGGRLPEAAGVVVCLASLAMIRIAWQVAVMPSLLPGDDVAAERYVDERLRFGRATSALLLSFVTVFFFVQMDYANASAGHVGASAFVWLTWIAFSAWAIVRNVRPTAALPA